MCWSNGQCLLSPFFHEQPEFVFMTQFWTPFELLLKENMLATIYSSFLLLSCLRKWSVQVPSVFPKITTSLTYQRLNPMKQSRWTCQCSSLTSTKSTHQFKRKDWKTGKKRLLLKTKIWCLVRWRSDKKLLLQCVFVRDFIARGLILTGASCHLYPKPGWRGDIKCIHGSPYLPLGGRFLLVHHCISTNSYWSMFNKRDSFHVTRTWSDLIF